MTYSYEFFKRIIQNCSPFFISKYLLFALMFCCSVKLSAQQIYTIDTDRANANYQLGETVVFQINSTVNGTANYEIIVDKHSPALTSGTITLQAGQTTELPFTATEAAVVMCKVKKDGITQMAAAAISSFDLSPIEEEPARFDEFWEEAHASLANIPIDPKLTLYRESEYATTYRVNIASIDNRRVYGYISVPKSEGPYPGVLTLPAYGRISNVVTPAIYLAEQAGALSFAISIHNVEPDKVDPKAYKPNNIMNEYTNYYRYAVLACLRGIDYLFSRSDFNGELAVTGVSQGGGLALMTAGLDKRVDLLVYSNASHCEHTGKKYDTASGFPYYLNQARLMYNIDASDEADIVEACKYYDAIYFARRYEGPSLGFISYQDEVSPPTTTFKAFNALKGQKILMHGKTLKHEHPQEYWVGRYDALRRFMPGTQRAPWPYARKTRGYFLDAGEDQVIEQGSSIEFSPTLIQHEEVVDFPATWVQLEGPADVTFSDPNALATTASFSMPGTYKLQVRVWDEALLESKSKFYSISDEITVFVHDENVPLLAQCPEDITLFTTSTTAEASWTLPTIQSACSNDAPIIMQTAGLGMGSAFPTGRTRVAYRIEDACGNQLDCSFYVTVLQENFTPLEISCPENITISTDNESAIGSWELPTILSACNANPTTYTQIEGLPMGSDFPIGETLVSYEVIDACGQTMTCSFTVTVTQEFEPLVITCPQDISFSTSEDELVVNWILPTVSSACNTTAVEYAQIEGIARNTAFPIGETLVTYQVTDACGQTTTCSFTVTVTQEFEPLIINCPSDSIFYTMEDELIINWELPTVSSACNTTAVEYTQIEGLAQNTAFPIGETLVTYEVTDACGQTTTCSFTVTLIQNIEPLVIACPNDTILTTYGGSIIPSWSLPSVISACSTEDIQYVQAAGPTFGNPFPVGETLITYKIVDSCGQEASCSFTIDVVQVEQPPLQIECPATITLSTLTGSALPDWELPSVYSSCGEGLQFRQIEGLPLGSVFRLGVTEISYEVMDGCGQIDTCSFLVEVVDENPPNLNIVCPFNVHLTINAPDTILTWELPEVVSACNTEEVTYTQVVGPARGSTFTEGTTRITYSVEDACGQIKYCSFNITIFQNMNMPLVVDCPSNINMMLPFGSSSSQVHWSVPEVVSFCSEELTISQIQGPSSGSMFREGTSTVSYIIQDGCGNRELCTFEVEVTARSERESGIDTFLAENTIQTYPNPTNGTLSLHWKSKQPANLQLEVVNLLGQVLYKDQLQSVVGQNTKTLELHDLPAGSYILQMRNSENRTIRAQFVKQ